MGSAMNGLPRRSLLRAALLVLAGAALTGGVLAACGSGAEPVTSSGPSLVRARPRLTHGVATGDARTDGAPVWARSDVPATMIVETAATENFVNPTIVRGPMLTPDSDGTGRVRPHGLSRARRCITE
jgi:alkaline phosphatase D